MADWVKAFAIYLVVVSHTAIARPVAHWAFMVEIPLFFFMSGYLFRFRSNPSFSAFAKKRFRQIIIPYITINTVTYLFWLLATRRFNTDNAAIPAWQPLVGIITCRSTLLHHNATMYFFTALFNIEILYYLLFRKRNFSARCLITLLLAMLGAADYYLSPSELPFSISHTLVGIVFYSLGYELRCSGVINTFMNSHSTEGILTKAFAATVFFAASLLLMQAHRSAQSPKAYLRHLSPVFRGSPSGGILRHNSLLHPLLSAANHKADIRKHPMDMWLPPNGIHPHQRFHDICCRHPPHHPRQQNTPQHPFLPGCNAHLSLLRNHHQEFKQGDEKIFLFLIIYIIRI